MVQMLDYTVIDKNLIVRLNEDLDHHNAEMIRTKIDNLIDDKNIVNLIIDFDNVSFMDSSGIGVIMGRYKKVCYQRGSVYVTGIGKVVDRIFTMAALYRITQKYDTIEKALAAIRKNI